MDKHTPGPYLRDGRTVYALTEYRLPTGHVVETSRVWANVCPGHECSQEEAEAVAVLFAAAPDLLEALKDLVDDIADRFDLDSPSTNPGIVVAVSRARAAIAKATGDAE